MKSFSKLALLAALGFAVAAPVFADTATITGNTIGQSQNGGSNNRQSLEAGVVDGGAFSGGSVRLTNNTIRQTQSGNSNVQTAVVGKIDKDFGRHSVTVSGNTITQNQSGSRNTQTLKVGVIE